jgi:hypothetical protein
MKTRRSQRRVISFVVATILLFQISPALAERGRTPAEGRRGGVDVTVTKWITTYPAMSGYTGGDLAGDFVGEILDLKLSSLGITGIEAIYTVEAERHSFAALIKGGENMETGAAVLDGVVLAGWRTGARVHVEFQQQSDCAGAPIGDCFVGTVHIDVPFEGSWRFRDFMVDRARRQTSSG